MIYINLACVVVSSMVTGASLSEKNTVSAAINAFATAFNVLCVVSALNHA